MDYTELLDNYGKLIEADLDEQLQKLLEDGQKYHPFLGEVYRATMEFVQRSGRRLAACSTLIVYKGYADRIDNGIDSRILGVCSAIELYRHSILIHDDIVDAEEERRGGKTLHRSFSEGFSENFGLGTAMFAGNILYALAIKGVLASGFDPDRLSKAASILSSEFKDVNESQILDMLFEYTNPKQQEWETMASRRAASLFRASMLAGALLAGAGDRDLKLLEEAARHIGYAFDIQDDIIDTFASEEQYGRVPCGDIGKRKKPLHVILALEREERLAAIMAEGRMLAGEDIGYVQALIRDCGALDLAKSISRGHAREAEKMISMTEMNQDAKDFFVSFIRYVDESLDWYK
ncbi:Geranylgeranyl diphosphate synthase [uncultured archaeon]|nr:Geranylgeranyl diphosphate synthase [uncultured archaeon]